MNTGWRWAAMGKLVALALALGIASAIVVYVVAKWQVDVGRTQSSSPFASALIVEATGQPGMSSAAPPPPQVSVRWPAITGLAVGVVVMVAGLVFMATGKE
jgi:hypothetical protein